MARLRSAGNQGGCPVVEVDQTSPGCVKNVENDPERKLAARAPPLAFRKRTSFRDPIVLRAADIMSVSMPILDHSRNVIETKEWGNVQGASLAEGSSPYGFGRPHLLRLRGRILLPRLVGQRVRARRRDTERRYSAAAQRAQPGDHGLHHAPSRGDRSIHSGYRDRRRRPRLVRGSQRPVVGIDNGRDLPGLGLGRGLAAALHGALQLLLGEPSRTDLCRYDYFRRGGCGGPDWTEPSGADAGTSQAVAPLREPCAGARRVMRVGRVRNAEC